MNRFVLVGNGFDLAHGLKTSYKDFLFWYLHKCFTEAAINLNYSDQILKVRRRSTSYGGLSADTITSIVQSHYQTGFSHLKSTEIRSDTKYLCDNPFEIESKSILLTQILNRCTPTNWVDIENDYYSLLVILLKSDPSNRSQTVKTLNQDLGYIIQNLQQYLLDLPKTGIIEGYSDILFGEFKSTDINSTIGTSLSYIKKDLLPTVTHIFNFNYTNTIEAYPPIEKGSYDLTYIHGEANNSNNPMVFGFGDELDKRYEEIEEQSEKDFFRYIKSFWYLRTWNYQRLLRFIEGEDYQVVVLGHSCGLSDRTLLNQIFTHKNCKSIKIYYHGDLDQNNFTDIIQEISRHFGKDKASFRAKVLNLLCSDPMPQQKIE